MLAVRRFEYSKLNVGSGTIVSGRNAYNFNLNRLHFAGVETSHGVIIITARFFFRFVINLNKFQDVK